MDQGLGPGDEAVIFSRSFFQFIKRIGAPLWALPVTLLIVCFFFPLAKVLGLMFQKSGEIYLSAIWQPLGFTVYQAILSTLLTLLFGLPAAYVFTRFDFTGKRLLRILTMLPFILPTVVVAAAFNALLGPHGWINMGLMQLTGSDIPPVHFLNTFGAILVAHVFYNVSIVIRVVGGAWSQLDPRLEQSASVLGASPWKVFQTITLPLLRRSILSASLLVFLFDFASFGVILMLGGPEFQTLEVAVYTQALYFLNLPMAGILSLVQLLCTLGVMLLHGRVNRSQPVPFFPRFRAEGTHPPRGAVEKGIVTLVVLTLFLLQVIPLLALASRSVFRVEAERGQREDVQSGLTLEYYEELFVNKRGDVFYIQPARAIANSLIFAGITMLIAVINGSLIAYTLVKVPSARRWLDPLVMLPFGASAVTLGLGFVVTFHGSTLTGNGFPWLIPLAHSLVAMPFVVRTVQPVLASIPPSLEQSAAVLGASPLRVWWEVEMPLISRAFLSAALFSFTISLGEFGATSFIARLDNPTMPLAIYRYLSQPGALNYGQAMAMATILIVICGISLLLLENLSHAALHSD